jgi:uncharacterized protein (DUF983 family)
VTIETLMQEKRPIRPAMWRGARGHCPACNAPAAMFRAYLKISDTCHACGLHLGGHEADDAPPYFTIFIVGHVIIPVALIVERAYAPPLYIHAILFCVLSVIVSLVSLPIVKGAIVGLQWALRMHGFAHDQNARRGDGRENE